MKRSLCLVGLSMLFCPLLACGAPGGGGERPGGRCGCCAHGGLSDCVGRDLL